MHPRFGGVGALQPKPAGTQGDALAVEVRDSQAAKLQGAADALPVNRPMAVTHLLAIIPEELAKDSVDLLEHGRAESKNHHDVGGHRRQHVARF